MRNRLLNVVSLIVNATIIIMVAYAVSTFFTIGGQGNMEVLSFGCFRYFTVLSNVLAALVSAVYSVYNIKCLKSGIKEIPFIALLLKFIGTVSVTVTFITVILFLGPTMGYKAMFEDVNLILHAIVPIMSIVSLTVFEQNRDIKIKYSVYGLIPTALYSIVYVIMVIFVKEWEDFYGFTFGGKLYLAPISIVVMYLATMLFSFGLAAIHNYTYKKQNIANSAKQ